MQAPLISIIVPVYKVEPYLRRCLDSIINQTYTNLEIILVDDGSPDNCPHICDEYAAKDNRIVVIHKANGGLSDARNAGLEICKGDFISFIDSDDWVEPNYIDTLCKLLMENDADISIVSFEKTTSPNNPCKHTQENDKKIEVLNPRDTVTKLFTSDRIIFVTTWGKLYKKHLFSNIRFPKGKLNEDEYVTYKLLYYSTRTVFQNIQLYNYFQHSGSIMANISKDSLRIFDAHLERHSFFKEKKDLALQRLCLKCLCWDLLFAYSKQSMNNSTSTFQTKESILMDYRKHVAELTSIEKFSIELLIHTFFAKFPYTYILYQKFSPYKIRKT
jgi:glycosyltransferase involved in cell wall biosynthesis